MRPTKPTNANVGRPVPAPVLCVEIEMHPDLSRSSPSQLQSGAEVTCEPKETHHAAAPRTVSFSSTEQLSIDDLLTTDAPPPLPNPATAEKGCTPTKKKKTNNGRKRQACKAEGCTNRAIQGGQCFRHGAKAHRKVCSTEGCKNYVVRAGVCIKHSARQGLTKKKAEEKPKHEKPAKRLKQDDDTSNSEGEGSVEKRGRKHKHKACKTEGCTNRVIQRGLCFRHGAKAHRKVCSTEGCKNYVVRAGVCIKHGARQGLKKNAEEEPKHEKPAKRMKQEDGTSIRVDDAQRNEQGVLSESESIDHQLEDSCAETLLLLRKDG